MRIIFSRRQTLGGGNDPIGPRSALDRLKAILLALPGNFVRGRFAPCGPGARIGDRSSIVDRGGSRYRRSRS